MGLTAEAEMKIDKKALWFPNGLLIRDERFSIEKWLSYHKSWIHEQYYANKRMSFWIEQASKETGISSKAIFISACYEFSVGEGTVTGKIYNHPSGEKMDLARVKRMFCGVSGGSVKASRKWRGFKKQVFMCAKILDREMKKYRKGKTTIVYIGKERKQQVIKPATGAAYAMFVYSPYPCKVKKMKQLWAKYFPEDFK